MKRETLANLTKDTSFHLEDGKSYKDIDGLVERIKTTNIAKTTMYNEWQRVEQERTSNAKAYSKRKTFQIKKFIAKVANVVNGQATVQYLTKPLGINTPQDFEADTVYYETVHYTSIMAKLVKVGRWWKWSYWLLVLDTHWWIYIKVYIFNYFLVLYTFIS